MCSIFFPSNLIQNFKEREDKKVVGCVRKVVFFNFCFPSNLVQNFKEREERDSGGGMRENKICNNITRHMVLGTKVVSF